LGTLFRRTARRPSRSVGVAVMVVMSARCPKAPERRLNADEGDLACQRKLQHESSAALVW